MSATIVETEAVLRPYRAAKMVQAMKVEKIDVDGDSVRLMQPEKVQQKKSYEGKEPVITEITVRYEPLVIEKSLYDAHKPKTPCWYVEYQDGFKTFFSDDEFTRIYAPTTAE